MKDSSSREADYDRVTLYNVVRDDGRIIKRNLHAEDAFVWEKEWNLHHRVTGRVTLEARLFELVRNGISNVVSANVVREAGNVHSGSTA